MNERIKQLAEQATTYIEPTANSGEGWIFDKEKFAVLVVQECVKVCADRGKHHDGLYSAWANDCSERIGKHFGVEE